MSDTTYSCQQIRKTVYFRIAGHRLKLIVPVSIDLQRALPTFAGFYEEPGEETLYPMTVEITESAVAMEVGELKMLSNISIVWQDNFQFEEAEKCYVTTVKSELMDRRWLMYSTKDFSHSVIRVVREELYSTSVLSWLLMVVYGQAILPYQSLMLHASVVEKEGYGYSFLGKSGTGKSTHSRLWVKYLQDTALLNDDNPVVRILPDGQIVIYGSPWSGKTDCYKNRGVPLRSMVRLNQSGSNIMHWKSGAEGLITVLPSCSSIRWNRMLFDQMTTTLTRIVQFVPIGVLDCLPQKAAAELCYNEINNKYKINEE
ncbi:hypothetical protein ACR79M_02425 [Sphingobacterium spiritivorum]|uniref:hypothetical protein n=1 Tax=Sphingobacterium spiritivorum TaxID=258 RepID=UPI003DA3069A